jgi:hypothetical protein
VAPEFLSLSSISFTSFPYKQQLEKEEEGKRNASIFLHSSRQNNKRRGATPSIVNSNQRFTRLIVSFGIFSILLKREYYINQTNGNHKTKPIKDYPKEYIYLYYFYLSSLVSKNCHAERSKREQPAVWKLGYSVKEIFDDQKTK